MKHLIVKRRSAAPDLPGFARVLPEIQSLIEACRQHVVSTANLTLVWLYWNVGRVITQDIQQHSERAGYGERLVEALGAQLTQQYGTGFSARSLWDSFLRTSRFCLHRWQNWELPGFCRQWRRNLRPSRFSSHRL